MSESGADGWGGGQNFVFEDTSCSAEAVAGLPKKNRQFMHKGRLYK